jgi:hypothetical protein
MLVFNNYFCKNRKSKLHFGDRVAVLNVFLYQLEGAHTYTTLKTIHDVLHADSSAQWHSALLTKASFICVPKKKASFICRSSSPEI